MKTKTRQWLWGAVLSAGVLSLTVLTAVSATLMEDKMGLERSIQERTERLVEKIIGSREMVVFVNVELEQETAKTAEKRDNFVGMQMTEEEYLPGITYSYIPSGGSGASRGASIKRINVLVILDNGINDAVAEKIKKELHELLGLDPLRNDAVSVKKIAFGKPTTTWKDYLGQQYVKPIYLLLSLIIVAMIIFFSLRIFFRNIEKTQFRLNVDERVKNVDQAAPGQGGPNVEVLPVVGGGGDFGGLPQAPAEVKGAITAAAAKHFQFVNENNLASLIYLLKKEQPEKVAVVIDYLPTSFATRVLASMSVKDQCTVASLLSEVKLLDQKEVAALEEDLKGKIDYLVGGTDTFISLIDQAERDTQENIVMTLEKENPILAEELKNTLFFFEDIVVLEKTAMQKVIRAAQRRGISLPIALKTSSEQVKQKILDALTEGAQAMLNEQISLQGEVPQKKIVDEQRKIAALVRELERANEIVVDRANRHREDSSSSSPA